MRGLIIEDETSAFRGDFKDAPALAMAIAQKETLRRLGADASVI
jgi:hypothetical protein